MMRASLGVVSLSILTLCGACEDSSGHEEELSEFVQESGSSNHNSGSAKAKLELKNGSSTYSHTSTRPWSLAKSGAVDPVTSTVTWTINATQGATGARRLVVNGRFYARNHGNVGAPIGNLVVTLQSKSGSNWITRSSNVANASLGDAATTAKIVDGNVQTITENSASGSLALYNANTNAVISLSPQVVLPAGASVEVKFTASFNNDVMNLATGTKVRAEVFASFGNAGSPGKSNVDINGNGGIDAYESRVNTESEELGEKTVPAAATTSTAVTLSDTLADITATGTATFSNAVFNLGATMGTVRVNYDGGTAGGTINNCAHLTGTGVNLTACDAQNIAPERFEWSNGDLVTYRQSDWGDVPNGTNIASQLAGVTPFATLYPLGLRVGILGVPGRFNILFSSGSAVLSYLPASGTPASLTSSYTDPPTTTSGQFGGEVVALKLNIDFDDAGITSGSSPIALGDVYLCGLTSPAVVNGSTVRGFLSTASSVLGGDTVAGLSANDATLLAAELSVAFLGGLPSQFADDHLSPTPCAP